MRHATESRSRPCKCGREIGDCTCNVFAEAEALDCLAEDFHEALLAKVHKQRVRGYHGWDDPAWSREQILAKLREHIDKGDMVDVAAFAMFAWNQEG